MTAMPPATIDDLLQALCRIERELESLNFDYERRDAAVLTNLGFDDAERCAEALLEQIHVATHETASNLGFARGHIALLRDYILFRNRFVRVTTRLMRQIIDGENVLAALELCRQTEAMPTLPEARKLFGQIRAAWAQSFGNQSFEGVAKQLRIPASD